MTKKLEIFDVDFKTASLPHGRYWVRYDAEGHEQGWSREGYSGSNAWMLQGAAFYVEFDAHGQVIQFVSCLRAFEDSDWAEMFGYGTTWAAAEQKCNSPEPEPAPAAKSITDITRGFCR